MPTLFPAASFNASHGNPCKTQDAPDQADTRSGKTCWARSAVSSQRLIPAPAAMIETYVMLKTYGNRMA